MRLDIGEHSSQYVSVLLEFVSKHKDDIMAKRIKNPYAGYATLRDEVFKKEICDLSTCQVGFLVAKR